MTEREGTFTMNVKDGSVHLTGPEASLKRALDLAKLVERFAGQMPDDFVMSFTREDQPAVQLGYFHKERMIELAQIGERE